jgi:iron complex outermembrane receptor protein
MPLKDGSQDRAGSRGARIAWAVFLLGTVLAAAGRAGAQDPDPPPAKPQDPAPQKKQERDLTELSIEELGQIEVTIASRRGQKLSDTAAAVTVIRGEDLRRTGVTSIAEALRMVPGMDVARFNSNTWAVSSRGFNGRYANKLQVLMDGRSVYNPFFAGVYWDEIDTNLEDIDRIEVIRGPGGALWGANAVNGVVNIITRKAADTQGGYVQAGGGTEEQYFGTARYGGMAADGVSYRAYAKHFMRDDFDGGHDDWWQTRAGFRVDWKAGAEDTISVFGDVFTGESRAYTVDVELAPFPVTRTLTHPDELFGGNVVVRWEHTFSATSGILAQSSFENRDREAFSLHEQRNTFDFDLQHHFLAFDAHDITWGAGYRFTADDADGSLEVSFDPEEAKDDVVSVFFQDDIAIVKDTLRLILGSRFEHNDYTGFEYCPNVRMAFKPHEQHHAWAAASRSVRVLSRTDTGFRSNPAAFPTINPFPPPPFGPPGLSSAFRDIDNRRAEDLIALELGYRTQPLDVLSFDAAAFYNIYKYLDESYTGAPFPEFTPLPAHLVFPQYLGNDMEGVTYGAEVSANWRVMEGWTIQGYYAALYLQLNASEPAREGAEEAERRSARGKAFLRSSWDLPYNFQIDAMGRYVGVLKGGVDVDSYFQADARLGWRATENLEVSLVGQNLMRGHHEEFKDYYMPEDPVGVERGVYLAVTGRF